MSTTHDPVNHPSHYCSHPSGVECITIVRHYDFNIGSAMKYLWRHGLKHEEAYKLCLQICHIVGCLVGFGKSSSYQIALCAHRARVEDSKRREYAELSVTVGGAGMLAGGF